MLQTELNIDLLSRFVDMILHQQEHPEEADVTNSLSLNCKTHIDHEEKTCILSFAGTINDIHMRLNFDIDVVKIDALNASVHSGVYRHLTQDNALGKIEKIVNAHDNYKWYIIGHSLGGAVAILCSYLLETHIQFTVVALSSPRFMKLQNTCIPTNNQIYNLSHNRDFANTPLLKLLGFDFPHTSYDIVDISIDNNTKLLTLRENKKPADSMEDHSLAAYKKMLSYHHRNHFN